MSITIQKVADFLRLLLNTTKTQVRALFYTLTPVQTAALCEILYNIHKLPLTKQVLKELRKRSALIKKLTSKDTSLHKKLALVQKHYRLIHSTLDLIKKEILSILG